jgi:hypothetical protein
MAASVALPAKCGPGAANSVDKNKKQINLSFMSSIVDYGSVILRSVSEFAESSCFQMTR